MTTEKGLESLIMRHMTGAEGLERGEVKAVAETAPASGGNGWYAGNPAAYDREYAVDTEQLFAFLATTQPEEFAKLGIADFKDKKGMAPHKFLVRLQGEVLRRGVIECCGKGSSTGR